MPAHLRPPLFREPRPLERDQLVSRRPAVVLEQSTESLGAHDVAVIVRRHASVVDEAVGKALMVSLRVIMADIGRRTIPQLTLAE